MKKVLQKVIQRLLIPTTLSFFSLFTEYLCFITSSDELWSCLLQPQVKTVNPEKFIMLTITVNLISWQVRVDLNTLHSGTT